MFFRAYRKLSLLHPISGPPPNKAILQPRASAREGVLHFYSGVSGVSNYRGYRTRLDRKLRDSGTPSFLLAIQLLCFAYSGSFFVDG